MDFVNKKCVPCEGSTKPHDAIVVKNYLQATPGWLTNTESTQIFREFILKDFIAALKLINQIGDIAEAEGHHPNIELYSWNHVKIVLFTHAISGLSDNDFIMAAKINQLWNNQASQKA